MLTNEEVDASTASHLIEDVGPGHPLIISFGFYAADNQPRFDFFGRLKKVEALSGRPLGKLLVRDSSQLWYLNGIPGMADGIEATAAALARIVAQLKPSHVVTLGQSMGAYAAILYGALLKADKVIAFGPLSCFDRSLWKQMGDTRWQPQLEQLMALGTDIRPYHDLAGWLPSLSDAAPSIDLLYGAHPGLGALPHEATGLDVPHAMRLMGAPTVTCLPALSSGHAIVEHYRAQGVMSDVLMQRLFGTPLAATIARLTQADPWAHWLADNLARGCLPQDLNEAMRAKGLAPAVIDSLNARIRIIPALETLAANPPRKPI
jgi:pimeloyl-ACP methyl ester carboxylesterase